MDLGADNTQGTKAYIWPEVFFVLRWQLRTDTGGSASICVFLNYSGIIVARILYYLSYERFYFFLSNALVIRKIRQKILKMEI